MKTGDISRWVRQWSDLRDPHHHHPQAGHEPVSERVKKKQQPPHNHRSFPFKDIIFLG